MIVEKIIEATMRVSTTKIYLLHGINLLLTALGFHCPLLTMGRERRWAVYRTAQSGSSAVSRGTVVEGESELSVTAFTKHQKDKILSSWNTERNSVCVASAESR